MALPSAEDPSDPFSYADVKNSGFNQVSVLRCVSGNISVQGYNINDLESLVASQRCFTSRSSSVFSDKSFDSQLSIRSHLSGFSLSSQRSLEFLPCLLTAASSLVRAANAGKSSGSCCMSTLKGHSYDASTLALQVEKLLSHGFTSDDIKLWLPKNIDSGFCKFGSGAGTVKALIPMEDRIFSSHEDHKIRVWKRPSQEAKAHKLIATIPTTRNVVTTFICPKNYIQVRRHKKMLWIQHVDTISVLAIGGKHKNVLYSGSWDRTVKMWRLSDFRCVESFKAHEDAVNTLVVSVDGYVYTGSADAKIKVWMSGAGVKKGHSLVTTLECHKSAVNALALSSDNIVLYSGSCDRSIVMWEREESAGHMSAVGVLRGHRQAVLCLASVGDNILCSGSADKTVRVWKRLSPASYLHSCMAVLEGHTKAVKCVRGSMHTMEDEEECWICSGSLDDEVKVWSLHQNGISFSI